MVGIYRFDLQGTSGTTIDTQPVPTPEWMQLTISPIITGQKQTRAILSIDAASCEVVVCPRMSDSCVFVW